MYRFYSSLSWISGSVVKKVHSHQTIRTLRRSVLLLVNFNILSNHTGNICLVKKYRLLKPLITVCFVPSVYVITSNWVWIHCRTSYSCLRHTKYLKCSSLCHSVTSTGVLFLEYPKFYKNQRKVFIIKGYVRNTTFVALLWIHKHLIFIFCLSY